MKIEEIKEFFKAYEIPSAWEESDDMTVYAPLKVAIDLGCEIKQEDVDEFKKETGMEPSAVKMTKEGWEFLGEEDLGRI